MNSHLPESFSDRFPLLHPDEIERFDVLVEYDANLQRTIDAGALIWRERLRRIYRDPQGCREAFLRRSVITAAKHGIQNDTSVDVLPKLAVYICARVEQLVLKMDFEEEGDSGE